MVINYLQKEKDGGDEDCWDLKQRKNECSDPFPIFSEIWLFSFYFNKKFILVHHTFIAFYEG